MIATHALAQADFDALASGMGDVSAITALTAGQYSKHAVQLRALLDAAAPQTRGDLEPGFELLSAAQETAPDTVRDLLLHPSVGNWLAHCLRSLRGPSQASPPADPDLGHLNAIAAAAAARAGLDFVIRVPARAGTVMLPGLGLARIPGLRHGAPVTITGHAGQPATLHGNRGHVVLPADPGTAVPGWRPLRQVTVGPEGHRLTIDLDDLDPFRDCHGSPVTGPLGPAAAARWHRLLEEAWILLTEVHPGYARGIGAGLRSIVPLRMLRPGRGTTATSTDSFGSCVMSEPPDPVTLAVSLVHEFQHAKLGALMDMLPLHSAGRAARYYAPWRDDPRPLGGLLHGAYAFLAVTDFWRIQRTVTPPADARFAHFEFARWREQTLHAADTLESSGELTRLGNRLVTAIRTRLRGWAGEVPAAPAAAARDAITDHLVSWRLRNVRPAPERVEKLAAAWRAGGACPPGTACPPGAAIPGTICPGGAALAGNSRLDLLLLRLREPARFAWLSTRPAELAALFPDAAEADVAYARGDLDAASEGYRRMLGSAPELLTGWSGLALIRRRRRTGLAGLPDDEPELVMAVARHLAAGGSRTASYDAVADWLAQASPVPVTGSAARCRTAGAADQ